MSKNVELKIKKLPTFRGRFGTRSKRRSSIAKWNKWRVATGIDIKWKRGDGNQPSIGYKANSELRHLHPRGQKEYMIRSARDIEMFNLETAKEYVFRFLGSMGEKKRKELLDAAKKKGMHILNK